VGQYKRFETKCNEPLVEVCLLEAESQGMSLTEVCTASGISWATILNFRRQNHPHGVTLKTLKKLANGINAKVVIQTADGRILDPEAMTEV
jgi:transcriptional regulator with XRE-family HTH domain